MIQNTVGSVAYHPEVEHLGAKVRKVAPFKLLSRVAMLFQRNTLIKIGYPSVLRSAQVGWP